MSTKRNKVASIFLILVVVLSVFALLGAITATTALAQEDAGSDVETDTDESDTAETDTDEEESGSDDDEGSSDGDSEADEDSGDSGDSGEQSEEEIREENQEIIENNDPDFGLINDVDIYDVDISVSEVVLIVHNDGDETAQISAANDGAREDRIEEDFELDAGDSKRVILPSEDIIETGASVGVYETFDERQELDEDEFATYVIDTIAWAPNHAPDVPHPFLLVFLVVMVNTGVIIWLVKSKNRTTEWAARLDRLDLGSQVLRKVRYHIESTKEDGLEYYIETVLIRLKHYNIAIVIGVLSVWGLLYLFTFVSLAGSHTISPAIPYPSLSGLQFWTVFSFDLYIPQLIENSTVYILYSSIVSVIFAATTLSYLLVKDRKMIDATNPKNGKGGLYALSKGRYETMDVVLETEEGYKSEDIDKSWLFQPIPGVDKFECKEYYMEANVAVVSWNGEVVKIGYKDIRTWRGKIDKLMDKLQLAEDKVSYLKLNYADDVKDTAEKMSVAQAQALEDEGYEGLGKVRKALDDRLDEKVEGDFQSLDELGLEEIDEKYEGDDDEKYKPDLESVEEVLDEEGDKQ